MSDEPGPEQKDDHGERGPIPWWLWLAVVAVLFFTFFIGAFNLCNP